MPDEMQNEITEFLYIISHDFKAPLRHVQQFSSLLEENLSDKMTEEDKQYMDIINVSITKMCDMLDGMLECSRLNTIQEQYSNVDLNKTLESVMGMLDSNIKETNSIISTSNLPIVKGSSKQLQKLLYILLDNSIKFHRENVPEICISIISTADKHVLTITDNGIGIKEKFKDDIFKIFRQLNAKNDYKGIGLGLYMAKQIVANHCGKIYLDITQKDKTAMIIELPMNLSNN